MKEETISSLLFLWWQEHWKENFIFTWIWIMLLPFLFVLLFAILSHKSAFRIRYAKQTKKKSI